MNITLLNFSPRSNGNCVEICWHIRLYYENANIRSYNVCECVSPCANCNYECLKPEERCPNVTDLQIELMDAIRGSDLVYYVIPNFCGMPNGVFLCVQRAVCRIFQYGQSNHGTVYGCEKEVYYCQ